MSNHLNLSILLRILLRKMLFYIVIELTYEKR